jgi:hypothetical protein
MTRTLRDVFREVCFYSSESDLKRDNVDEWWSRLVTWPPDVFAVTSTILSDSGAYRLIVSPPGPAFTPCSDRAAWLTHVAEAARSWQEWLIRPTDPMPEPLVEIGQELSKKASVTIESLGLDDGTTSLVVTLLKLHAMADMAGVWLGVPDKIPISAGGLPFVSMRLRAELGLALRGTLASFPPDKLRVLPKLRTPQVGISVRSLSLHLAVMRSEVSVDWSVFPGGLHQLAGTPTGGKFNLLLFPWPFEIAAAAFSESKPLPWANGGGFGAFDYDPRRGRPVTSVAAELSAAVEAARAKEIQVHGVVLPEAAIDDAEFWQIAGVLERAGIGFLLAGVRGAPREPGKSPTNVAKLGLFFPGSQVGWHVYEQAKHHRWCIDAAQIYQYHLGSTLDPALKLWENIELLPRKLHFIALSSWLTLCHLICEDLARVDPVLEVVRAVGPNLLIALLLDGPQLEQRWPARYASVLADDPGTSVLTLSSLGLVQRSTARGHAQSRVVGLWKDRVRGTHELVLDRNAKALVLALCGGLAKEFSADGRDDDTAAGQIVLGGVEQLSWDGADDGPAVAPAGQAQVATSDWTVLCIVTDALASSPAAFNEIMRLAQQATGAQNGLALALQALHDEFTATLPHMGELGNNRVWLVSIRDRLCASNAPGAQDACRALTWTLHGRV